MVIGKRHKGFTLLELLIVIAIIGIMLSVVVLSTDFLSRRYSAKVFGQTLERLIVFSSEIAISRQQEVGIKFYPDTVVFKYKKDADSSWEHIHDVRLLRARDIPKDIKYNLEVNKIYRKTNPNDPEIVFSTSGDMTPFILKLMRGQNTIVIKGYYDGHVEII